MSPSMELTSEFRIRALPSSPSGLPKQDLVRIFDLIQGIFHSYRVDEELNCIKGGGGCHLREKVLAEAAETCVFQVTQ